jgi:hypothetical protein
LKRNGGAVWIVGAVLAAIIIAAGGLITYFDIAPPPSQSTSVTASNPTGNSWSGYDIAGTFSGVVSTVKDGLDSVTGWVLPYVDINGVGLVADTFTGNESLAPSCSATPRDSYIGLTNKAPLNRTAKELTITYRGEGTNFAISGPCTIEPSGSSNATMYVVFAGPSRLANAVPSVGQQYTGTVTLSNGAHLSFAGVFFQGYPQVSISNMTMRASGFAQSQPTNSTCSAKPTTSNAYVELTNTGTVGAAATEVTLTWNDVTYTAAVSGSCYLGPDGTPSSISYLLLGASNGIGSPAQAGQSFVGTVTLSTGVHIPFRGTFE